MNIAQLKTLVANLPVEITPEQFGMIEAEVEDLLARQRQADEAELAATEERAAKLREKLGLVAGHVQHTPTTRAQRPAPPSPVTDADAGYSFEEEGQSNASFQAELAALRNRNVSRRRREH